MLDAVQAETRGYTANSLSLPETVTQATAMMTFITIIVLQDAK